MPGIAGVNNFVFNISSLYFKQPADETNHGTSLNAYHL